MKSFDEAQKEFDREWEKDQRKIKFAMLAWLVLWIWGFISLAVFLNKVDWRNVFVSAGKEVKSIAREIREAK